MRGHLRSCIPPSGIMLGNAPTTPAFSLQRVVTMQLLVDLLESDAQQ